MGVDHAKVMAAALGPVMAALRRYEACLGDAGERAGPPLTGAMGTAPRRRATQRWCRAALLDDAVSADAFLRPAARICVAEPTFRRQVLALRALFARRSAVRRCIDRASLAAMAAAVGGNAVLTRLRGAAAEDGETRLPLPLALDPDTLARDGLLRLMAGEPAAAMLATLAGYAGVPAADAPVGQAEVGRTEGDHTEVDRAENARFFQRLPHWMPERP